MAYEIDGVTLIDWLPWEFSEDLYQWLAAHGPDDWHGVAATWNFDQGFAQLGWICEQAECDRGTAVLIFWMCGPTSFMTTRAQFAAYKQAKDNTYPIARRILSLWNENFYKRSEIQLREMELELAESGRAMYHEYAPAFEPDELGFSIPADFRAPTSGRTIDYDELRKFDEGVPVEIRERYKDRRW